MKTSKIKHLAGFVILLSVTLMFNSGCSYALNSITGNGNVIKQTRDLPSFSSIEVGGAFKVFLLQGDKESVIVEADENLMEIIITEVRGNNLVITTSEDIRNPEALNIYLTFKTLDRMEISGACELSCDDRLKFGNLDLECSGASDVTLKMSAEALKLDFSGASQVDLFGNADEVNLDLSGASDLDAIDLEANKYNADISGAANARIFVKNELTTDVSGASSLRYKGEPSIVNNDISGAASVKKY
jgi:hypothetical protein